MSSATDVAQPSFLSQLTTLLTVLIALSIATERIVAIIQNFVPGLRSPNSDAADATKDGPRRATLQLLSVVLGIGTAFMAQELLTTIKIFGANATNPGVLVTLGLLASGGSGFWTAILGYVTGLKEIQKSLATATKAQADTALLQASVAKVQVKAQLVAISNGIGIDTPSNPVLEAIPALKAALLVQSPGSPSTGVQLSDAVKEKAKKALEGAVESASVL